MAKRPAPPQPAVEYDEAVQTFTTQLPSGAGLTIRRTVSTPKPLRLTAPAGLANIDEITSEDDPVKASARLMDQYLKAGSALMSPSHEDRKVRVEWSIEIKRMRTSMKSGHVGIEENVQTLTLDEREAPALFSVIRMLLSLDGPAHAVSPYGGGF